MELRHSRHRKYKGEWVWPGDPVEDYTEDQADRMVDAGQAYWVEVKKSKSDIYRELQDRGISVDWQTPVDVMRDMYDN